MPTNLGDWIGQWLSGGRYHVTAKLGEGGMGAVYRAHDANLDTDVVIKVPHPLMLRDRESAVRFAREIRSLVQLAHPHIVKILDAGQHHDLPFAVMQYLPGGSLEDRRTFNSPGQALPVPCQKLGGWLDDIAEALDFIHSQGYIHRDVKPGNILFDAHGNVFLSDFGVAKAIAQESEAARTSVRTEAGKVLGTPEYMAPEAVLGKPCDGRVDQYALAVLLFELLCGRLPFTAAQPTAIMMAHLTQPVPELRASCPQIPASVAAAVQKGLVKEPTQRYATCGALAAAFAAATRQAGAAAEVVYRHNCPVCHQVLRVAEKAAGQRIPCPGCKAPLAISPDRQRITLIGGRTTGQALLRVAVPLDTAEKANGVNACPSPTLPATTIPARPGRRRVVLAVGVSVAALVLSAILAGGLWTKDGGSNIAQSTPQAATTANPLDLAPAKNADKDSSGGQTSVRTADRSTTATAADRDFSKTPATPPPPKPVEEEMDEVPPKPKPDIAATPPAAAKPMRPVEDAKPSSGAKPAAEGPLAAKPAKLPAPSEEEQLQIGRTLYAEHELGNAQSREERIHLGRKLLEAYPTPSPRRFVAIRLAAELAEDPANPGIPVTLAEAIHAEFVIDPSAIKGRLLPRVKPPDPVTQMLIEASEMAQNRQIGRASAKLAAARAMFPDDVRIDFLLGLMLALRDPPDFAAAAKCFGNCVNSDDVDLRVRAYNNLAIVSQYRNNNVRVAVENLETAVKLAKAPPAEILQNLGRIRHIKLQYPALVWRDYKTRSTLDKLYEQTGANIGFQPNIGWLVMPLVGSDDKPLGGVPAEMFEDRRCRHCLGAGCMLCFRGIEKGLVRQADMPNATWPTTPGEADRPLGKPTQAIPDTADQPPVPAGFGPPSPLPGTQPAPR